MTAPTIVEITHALGREEARRRLKARIGELPGHIPGGMASASATWPDEDRMAIEVTALGQTVSATVDVEERCLRVTMLLPAMLGFFSGAIASVIRDKGGEVLLSDRRA